MLRTGASAGTPYSYYINKVKKIIPEDFYETCYFQVSTADSGIYSCVAGNILGESVSTAYLDVSLVSRCQLERLLLPIIILSHIMINSWTSLVTGSSTL